MKILWSFISLSFFLSGTVYAGVSEVELAKLLVKLELQTRAVIASKFSKSKGDSKEFMIEHKILPAAVADSIFSKIVPQNTDDRAWVRMVVDNPRNPNNRGDEVALGMINVLKQDKVKYVEQDLADAYYYAEPIVAKKSCLECHGNPKGAPDPHFPEYRMEGWKVDQVIGGVVARVTKE
jgi:methyl-accepting chemotaxis protein